MTSPPSMRIERPDTSDDKLIVRPARASDRDAIIEMSKHIWGGLDYLPRVWDKWLADPNGGLLTVLLDGEPVGVSKVTLLSPGEVWLEGLRLHPKLHGRGLTKQINRVSFREALKHDPRSIRYATGVGNAASRHLGETRGFWLAARTHWTWGKTLRTGNLTGRIASLGELDDVMEFIRGTGCYRDTSGLLAVDWKFLELKRERVRALIRAGRVLIAPRQGRIRAAAIYERTAFEEDSLCLGFVDGPDKDVQALARDVLRIAGRGGIGEISAMLPTGRISDLVFGAGYDLIEPAKAIAYELGARGARGLGETFEDTLMRTLLAHEAEAADLLTDLLLEHAPDGLSRINVQDFVYRQLLPDATRELFGQLERATVRIKKWDLRNIARSLVGHLIQEHGMGENTARFGKTGVTFFYAGRPVVRLRFHRADFDVVLGPGFGPCFSRGARFAAERVTLDSRHRDRKTGRYEGMTLRVTGPAHKRSARRAIDMMMRCARKHAAREAGKR